MNKLIKLLLLVTASIMALNTFATFQPSYVTLNGTFHDLNSTTGNPDFQGTAFGDFNIGDTWLIGSEMNITGGNVEYARTGWGVTDTSDNIVKAFVETSGTYNSSPSGNDRWLIADGDRPNILTGLSNGSYKLKVYLHGKYNGGGDFYESNSGNDYVATFSVVPETSSLVMLGLTGLAAGLVLRKRKRA